MRLCKLLLFQIALGLPLHGEQPATKPLVVTQAGTIPIILSAPHGGTEVVPGVPVRKGEGIERGGRGFVIARDGGTQELARDIANAIEKRMGGRPYFVLAEFHRRYLDPNRPAQIAYEHPDAKPFYDRYHGALSTFAKEVNEKFGRGLVLDIHGQGSARDTIFRGTQNGKTVALLMQRHGRSAQVGPESFFGLLAAAGCKVHPADDAKEQAGFTGGYIVQTYGGANHFGLDAIQLEFGGDYRAETNRKATAEKIATAVTAFSKLYLPVEAVGR